MTSKILLADDSVTIQKVVELTFADGDYEVTCMSDGTHVRDRVRDSRPDIVLLDVILPGENGYDICDAIKSDPSLAGIPVLLLTGTFEPFDRRRAEVVGADGHLTKPFESQVLVSKVTELLQAARRRRVSTDGGVARIINEGAEYDAAAVSTGSTAAAGFRPSEPPPAAAAPVLGEDAIDRIARKVAEQIGGQVIHEIAWEIVPELAERLVRQRIREIEAEAE